MKLFDSFCIALGALGAFAVLALVAAAIEQDVLEQTGCDPHPEFTCVAVKRSWVPEWLWTAFKPVVIYQPLRWVLTTRPGRGGR